VVREVDRERGVCTARFPGKDEVTALNNPYSNASLHT